jgi:hypothetical protein
MRPRAGTRRFLVLLAVVAIYRLTLLDRGALAMVDETWYFKSVMTLEALARGHVHEALGHIATTLARPGATLIRLPVAALQAIPLAFGVPPSNPRSLLIGQVCNVGVSLVILYFFFEIALLLCGDATAALVAAIVYALLVNTNLYVRHMLPYDWALCVAMGALWYGLRRPLTARRAFVAGLLAAVTITIYPGYYVVAPVLCIAIAGQAWREGPGRAAYFAVVFGAAGGLVIALTELLSRAGGLSYISSARAVSRMIELGSMEEGWTFLPEYLLTVERLSGIVLIAGTLAALSRTAANIRRGALRPIDWLLLPAVAGMVWQAAYSAHWHKMVIFGRLIHPWMLFMAWAVADTIARIERPALRNAVVAAIVTAALASFIPSARDFYRLAYPSDVLYALGIDTARVPVDRAHCELSRGMYFSPNASPGPLNRTTNYPYSKSSNFVLVNFCQAVGLLEAPLPPTSHTNVVGTLVFEGPHWMTFPAYGFEGLPPDARDALVRLPYRVRAYRIDAPAAP